MNKTNGIRAQGGLLEFLLWVVIAILLSVPTKGVSVVFLIIPLFNWFFTVKGKDESFNQHMSFGRVGVVIFSLGTVLIFLIIGDLFRAFIVKRIYTGTTPLKYGIFKFLADKKSPDQATQKVTQGSPAQSMDKKLSNHTRF